MGRTFKKDLSLVREAHRWKTSGLVEYEWGASVRFYCENPGCPTTMCIPVRPEEHSFGGICFDTSKAEECEP